jgi:2-hydroxychromene-2-carboxylate isomerase
MLARHLLVPEAAMSAEPAAAPPRLQVLAYTDYKSPYAFVASAPTRALALSHPVDIVWRPYTLRIAEYLGSVEDRSAHNWRRVRYAYMDARRLANRQGLILKGPRRIYHGELASLGMLFAQREGFFPAYHDSTFERFWRHDLDIDDMGAMREHLRALGGDPDAFERYATGEGAREHQALIADAEARGVFGVPTLIFQDEMFWGGDRIDLLRQAIEQALLARAPRGPRSG